VVERIAETTSCEVFLAVDRHLDRTVALKLLWHTGRPKRLANTEAAREARALASIRHPNVAIVHGLEYHEGRIGLWMEFIRGMTLEQLLQLQGRMSAWEATLIGLQICDAVSAVHAANLLHRDIKLQNVMREEGGRIVLTDFGTTQTITSAATHTRGTPPFVAPELLNGARPTVQSDVYAIGVVLFKLVTDEYPQRGTDWDDVRDAHATTPLRHPSDLRADLPHAFVDVLTRALAPDPRQRFCSVRELRTELQRALPGTAGATIGGEPPALETRVDARPIGQRPRIFVSYCHQDLKVIQLLRVVPLIDDLKSDGCDVWIDLELTTGDAWHEVVTSHLKKANIIVPLITQAYLRSKYCQEVEMRHFLTQRLAQGLVVFPFIVSPCEWERHEWLRSTQFTPRKGSLMGLPKTKRDEVLIQALGELRRVADRFRPRSND
jgi:serine/threonine-protein kinase